MFRNDQKRFYELLEENNKEQPTELPDSKKQLNSGSASTMRKQLNSGATSGQKSHTMRKQLNHLELLANEQKEYRKIRRGHKANLQSYFEKL